MAKPKTEPDSSGSAMDPSREMTRQMRENWLWTNFAVMTMGAWLVSSPFTFAYQSRAMTASDVLSGLALIFLSGLALWPRFDFLGRWGVASVAPDAEEADDLVRPESPSG